MTTHSEGVIHRVFMFGHRAFRYLATLSFHAAAGTLRLADLRGGIRDAWENFGASDWERHYFDSGLMDWERTFYPRFLKANERVLVIGCGSGRDVMGLLELGYRAEGIDVGPRCTEAARRFLGERGRETPLYTGAIESAEIPGHFDGFIFSWFCYSYIPESRTRIRVLRKLADHLRPGGRVFVTYVPDGGLRRRLPIALTRIVARIARSDWRPEYGDVLNVTDRPSGFHYEHQFGREALEAEARAAGFTVTFHDQGVEGRALLVR